MKSGPRHFSLLLAPFHWPCLKTTLENAKRLAAIKSAFEIGFAGYEEHAWGCDELLPVDNSSSNTFGGWGATAVDALGTAIIMDLPEIVDKILDYIPTIKFDAPRPGTVSLFETTIRYLGGILSAYDLMKEKASAATSADLRKMDALLTQAVQLANNMTFAFNTTTGIPQGRISLHSQSHDGSHFNTIAGCGTLVLEWTRLSDITGDPTYTRLTQKAEEYLLNPQPASSEPFPGLIGTRLQISNGQFLDASGGWGGSGDSYYEYLIKMYAYDNKRFSKYKHRWILAADSTMANLTSHPAGRSDLTFVANFHDTRLELFSSNLACFHGGNFIFGGVVLQEQKYVRYGLDLVASCRHTYSKTATGIGPDGFRWDSNVPLDQQDFYDRNGFYIDGSSYLLRPEVLESYYYAYRATGDQKYREWCWEAISAILHTTRVGSGYSQIHDVNIEGGGGFKNMQESFFFAEVLKYAYLIFAPDAVYQVANGKRQHYVFNTEAHPLKVALEL
ncbi:glycoside hydrolase family 47 protein [Myriangium duriaei CBS 260.36]|uniref:alpha-1,2-Mannosidase n=1 Tax=Myriangium duriaei CBS 260.36 TaxID=1168546 RepID=A0A9P4IRC5_9PEZI|nr:glycoside hydrolase family 47 protein [Myriangium duriaei CBS 260.36]